MDTQAKHRIEIQERTSPGSSRSHWEDVSNLEELKEAMAKYGPRQFYREAYDIYGESRHEVGSPKAAESFTQEDFDWLIEDQGKPPLYDRYIAFKTY